MEYVQRTQVPSTDKERLSWNSLNKEIKLIKKNNRGQYETNEKYIELKVREIIYL